MTQLPVRTSTPESPLGQPPPPLLAWRVYRLAMPILIERMGA